MIAKKSRGEMLQRFSHLIHFKCESATDRYGKTVDLFNNPFDPPNTRDRRQLGALVLVGLGSLVGMAISSIGSWLFPSHSLLGLSNGFSTGESDAEIEIIQQHELQIKINERAIAHLKDLQKIYSELRYQE